MQVFKNRRDPEYLRILSEALTIEGPGGLLATAVPIARPFERDARPYSRCCRIDFAGISATNLFDAGHEVVPTSVADRMQQLFDRAHELNEQGIFVKLRLLVVYPYSAHALARMQAEATRNRASMDHPTHARDLHLIEAVDEHIFDGSTFVRTQTVLLEQLQEWVDQHGWSQKTVNRAVVRFAPMSVNTCLLTVNDRTFVDPYLLAKRNRASKHCVSLAPLVEVSAGEDAEAFSALQDHFRYLWDLDLTIDCDDATYYRAGKRNTLAQIKPPQTVKYEAKAARLRASRSEGATEEDLTSWRFKMSRLLQRYCMTPAPTPRAESLFITCSWERREDNVSEPNSQARSVSTMLEEDFGRRRKPGALMSVHIMEGVAGEFLTRQLFSRMEESTLGLVLMTADITGTDGQQYCRPNIYHELGFLMKHLTPNRVILVCEEGVSIPSNINDVVRVTFERGRIALCYREIVNWIDQNCSFGADAVRSAFAAHIERLQKMTTDGFISPAALGKAEKRLTLDSEAL